MDIRLESEKTLLVIIDMQICEKIRFNNSEWDKLTSNINKLRKTARRQSMGIVHVFYSNNINNPPFGPIKFTHENNVFDPNQMQDSVGQLGANEHFVDTCFPENGDWVFGKNDSNALSEKDFPQIIAKKTRRKISQLIISGVMMSDCVKKTAFSAVNDHRYTVYVPIETTLVPAVTNDLRKNYLEDWKRKTQIKIPTLNEMLEMIEAD